MCGSLVSGIPSFSEHLGGSLEGKQSPKVSHRALCSCSELPMNLKDFCGGNLVYGPPASSTWEHFAAVVSMLWDCLLMAVFCFFSNFIDVMIKTFVVFDA